MLHKLYLQSTLLLLIPNNLHILLPSPQLTPNIHNSNPNELTPISIFFPGLQENSIIISRTDIELLLPDGGLAGALGYVCLVVVVGVLYHHERVHFAKGVEIFAIASLDNTYLHGWLLILLVNLLQRALQHTNLILALQYLNTLIRHFRLGRIKLQDPHTYHFLICIDFNHYFGFFTTFEVDVIIVTLFVCWDEVCVYGFLELSNFYFEDWCVLEVPRF